MNDTQTVEGEMMNIRQQIKKFEKEIAKLKKEGRPIPAFYERRIGELENRLAYIQEEVL